MADDPARYDRYQALKGWHEVALFTPRDEAYYRAELRGFPIRGARVIEIGFGAGHCLAWLREAGALASGIELQEPLVAAGRARGFDTHLPDAFDWAAVEASVDLILGFDVIEHLTDTEIADLLRKGSRALRPGGGMVFRFPNGSSPFGLHLLAADPTHRTAINGPRLRHLIAEHAIDRLRVEAWRDQAMTPAHGIARRLRRALGSALRAVTRVILHNGYLRGAPIPLAMNAVAVIRKAPPGDR